MKRLYKSIGKTFSIKNGNKIIDFIGLSANVLFHYINAFKTVKNGRFKAFSFRFRFVSVSFSRRFRFVFSDKKTSLDLYR